MSKVVIINASPRSGGTSVMLAALCKTFLEEQGCDVSIVGLYQGAGTSPVVDTLLTADTVVISGPCYINTYPAPVIRLLEEWAVRRPPAGQAVYGIVQGGMPYSHTHKSALNMLEVFAEQTGLSYKGGFILGLGAMLDGKGLDKLPNSKKVKRQLVIFFSNIRDGVFSGDEVYEKAEMKVPAVLAKLLALTANRSIDKKYAKRGIDAHAESPYTFDKLVK